MAGAPLAGDSAYLTGKPCPACGYVRAAADRNPGWQCPQCHVAYVKFETPPAPIRKRVAAEAREMALEARSDYSFHALIGSNVLALVIGSATGMGLREMMFVYWIQSVIIGITHVVRMLVLREFNTATFHFSGRPMQETFSDKLKLVFFFVMFYGMAHAVFFGLMLHGKGGGSGSALGYSLCALVFAANHTYSLLHNLQRDTRARPHLALLMFLPFARIVPMHVTIVLGQGRYASVELFFLFGGLKTIADVVMHTIEHHLLAWSGKRPAR
jgi:hypothetical protein